MNSAFSAEELAAVERWLTGVIDALKIETERLEDPAEHRRTRSVAR